MSHLRQFEVKVLLKGGTTMVTIIHAENDYRARELAKIQFGDKMTAIYSVREIR